MTRILIADDHPVACQGLQQIVHDDPDIVVVGAVYDMKELFERIRQQEVCDLIVLDIHMPGTGALHALKELKQQYPSLPVLVLSMHPEDQYAIRALRLGAAGYLTTEHAPEELVKAIRKIAAGGRYVRSSLADKPTDVVGIDTPGSLHHRLRKGGDADLD